MGSPILHQFTEAAIVGDATTDQAFLIRRWLRSLGFQSEIYTEHCQAELESEVRAISTYRPDGRESLLIYHHAIGAAMAERLLKWGRPLILIYHNITPPGFYTGVDPALAHQLEKGREQLKTLQSITTLALGDSAYNEAELQENGYRQTGVLPIVLDEAYYNQSPSPDVVARYSDPGPVLLFVGRLSPNKKQEDLIKLLYFYRRIEPSARLVLVGSGHQRNYEIWLQDLAEDLELDDAVVITGHVSHQDMVTYFKVADLYVSMSEHEGFGKPLVESMLLDLPVLAYSSTAVPYTMGQAGVLFNQKDYEALAEFVDMLLKNDGLRQRIIARQREHVQTFLEAQVSRQWQGYLTQLGLLRS